MHFCGANQETVVDWKLFYNQKHYLEQLRSMMYFFVCFIMTSSSGWYSKLNGTQLQIHQFQEIKSD